MKFKTGDKVKCINSNGALRHGEIYTVSSLRDNDETIDVRTEDGRLLTYWYESRFELVKKGKSTPVNHDKFMAYGTGCNNKSDLIDTEKELKEKLKELVHSRDWTGDIIGYKLVALYKAEKTVKLKPIKPIAKKKGRKPKKK